MNFRMKSRRLWSRWACGLICLAAMSFAGSYQVSDAQPAEVTCGETLTADTLLANDLSDCSGDGLILGTSDIRLDCASHALTGSNTGIGILISPDTTGIEVVNCDVRNFDTGLQINGNGRHEMLHNTIVGNRVGVLVNSGDAPNVIANNVFNNSTNVLVEGEGANRWDRQEGVAVAFRSPDMSLVGDDSNGEEDIFVYDRELDITARVNVSSDGAEADRGSDAPALSENGRWVAFQSQATNLTTDDANGEINNIFLHDRQTGATIRLSLASEPTDGDSIAPDISADGRIVAFQSNATNLVADDANEVEDIFVHDRRVGTIARVSVASDGTEGDGRSLAPAISRDGQVVAFQSLAANFADGDDNRVRDIFVHDRQSGTTTRVSVASDGTESDGHSFDAALSAKGNIVAFESAAMNLIDDDTNEKTDIFVHDRQSGMTTRVSIASDGAEADDNSVNPALSAGGRFVAFRSVATNLVDDDTNEMADIFVHDRQLGTTERVSVGFDGTEADGNSQPGIAISADGRLVAFQSFAANLVPDDTNGARDTFVYDRQTGTTTRVSLGPGGAEARNASFSLAMTVSSRETNIVGGSYLGGNFYASPDGLGFSQGCPDDNRDGFCDAPFVISEGNVDRFPLK